MIPDELGQELHSKATSGRGLSAEEKQLLESWYDGHDREELRRLACSPGTTSSEVFQNEIKQILDRILVVTQRIQLLEAENAKLRQEIRVLQRQLPRSLAQLA